MSLHKVFGVSVISVALVACSGDISSDLFATDGSVQVDGGSTSAPDSGVSHPGQKVDSSVTATPDGGTTIQPTPDATTIPPGIDSGTTTTVDAHVGGHDTGTVTPTGVSCGALTCTSSQSCCVTEGNGGGGGATSCVDPGDTCDGVTYTCLANSDCGGKICCVKYGQNSLSASCESTCSGQGEGQICSTSDDDCPNGQSCYSAQGSLGYGVCGTQGGGSGFGGH